MLPLSPVEAMLRRLGPHTQTGITKTGGAASTPFSPVPATPRRAEVRLRPEEKRKHGFGTPKGPREARDGSAERHLDFVAERAYDACKLRIRRTLRRVVTVPSEHSDAPIGKQATSDGVGP